MNQDLINHQARTEYKIITFSVILCGSSVFSV